MDWNRVEGSWKQVKGAVKEKWGKLTDDDLDVINGRREQLEGKIQERYGLAKDQIRSDVDAWYNSQTLLNDSLRFCFSIWTCCFSAALFNVSGSK